MDKNACTCFSQDTLLRNTNFKLCMTLFFRRFQQRFALGFT